ncbi:MAG: hypothetical protein M3020_29010 [Myxococcota bacterium]|nr:hypothetical protein [Myxococcota bacterium]
MIRALETRFDWYEVTFDGADDGRERTALALALGAEVTRGKPRNGYAECWVFERDGGVLAQLYGRSARLGELHVVTSSEACDEVVPIIRQLWPEHRVSRADSAVDYAADFDALDRIAVGFAVDRGISYRLVSDSNGGATRYLGAPTSELRVRVYKKSEQLRALHPEAAATVPDGIVRVELQARPGKRAVKERASLMGPDDLWGLAAWSQLFALETLGFDAPRVPTHFRRPSDWDRALHYLGQQYGPGIERRVLELGADRVRAEVLEALGLS